jgi:hypothetical protein
MRVALIGIVLCSALCVAQDDVPRVSTGTELLETCTKVNSVTRRADNFDEWATDAVHTTMASGTCFGFIQAVEQFDDLASAFCGPEHFTYGQAKKIVIKYLNDHPEQLHLPATFLVGEALGAAFPCPAKKPTKHPATRH